MGCNDLSIPKLQRCNCWSYGMDEQFHPILYWTCSVLPKLFTAPVRIPILRRFGQVKHTIPVWQQNFLPVRSIILPVWDEWLGRTLDLWLFMHDKIKVNPYKLKGPRASSFHVFRFIMFSALLEPHRLEIIKIHEHNYPIHNGKK